MSSIPPVPPAVASAAGAIGSNNRNGQSSTSGATAAGQQPAIEASAEGGDRDADGRDLREHKRKRSEETLEQALDEATGAEQRGGLDISV